MSQTAELLLKVVDEVTNPLGLMKGSVTELNTTLSQGNQLMQDYQKKQEAISNSLHTAKTALSAASKELKEAESAYSGLNDEVSKSKLNDAYETYNKAANAVENLKTAYKDTKDALKDLGDEQRKLENRSGSGSGFGYGTDEASLMSQLAQAGLFKQLGSSLAGASNTLITSALGSETGSLISSVLGGAASGAAIGSLGGGIGTAVGAGIGALSGLITGGTQIYESRDSAFRDYVQTMTEDLWDTRESDIAAGSEIAAGRETDQVSFTTLFGSKARAEKYLADLVDMANTTPFLYDDLTSMSKTLATYGYGSKDILPVLQTVGNTGAALGMSTSDMTAVATALGRMKSSDKTSLEYLNILNDRGINAVGMLADHYGVSQATIYDKISKGSLKGTDTVEILLAGLEEKYPKAMEEQSKTYAGKASTLEGLQQEMQNAYGEGYNETRKEGLDNEIDFLSGESGEKMKEANAAIGEWYATLENQKEEYKRDAMTAVMDGVIPEEFSEEDQKRLQELYDEVNSGGMELGQALMEAQAIAANEYNATDGAKALRESELALAENIREDTATDENFWNAGYKKSQQFTKGFADGLIRQRDDYQAAVADAAEAMVTSGVAWDYVPGAAGNSGSFDGSHAVGLERVPYDGYRAILHEGERVQTAAEVRRGERAAPVVNVTVNVPEGTDGDLAQRVAAYTARELSRALENYAG